MRIFGSSLGASQVPIPKGLDLDAWINEPSDSEQVRGVPARYFDEHPSNAKAPYNRLIAQAESDDSLSDSDESDAGSKRTKVKKAKSKSKRPKSKAKSVLADEEPDYVCALNSRLLERTQ